MLRRQDAFVVSAEPRAVGVGGATDAELYLWRKWVLERVELAVWGLGGDAAAPDCGVPNKLPLCECDLQVWASDPRTTDDLQAELLAAVPAELKCSVFEVSSTEALGLWLCGPDGVNAVRHLERWGVLNLAVAALEARGWVWKH